ncbi:MAG: hypothetical protein E7680_01250 [Ruminococcaceae bacterium]|nr:hypothetical protein [Oscillospiraceae bacterium]
MTILENLWYGNVHPVEEFLEVNKEYKNLLRIAAKDQERLGASLTPEQAELFEKYDSAVKEVNATAEVEAFSYGFRLGVRLMTEPFGVIRDKA